MQYNTHIIAEAKATMTVWKGYVETNEIIIMLEPVFKSQKSKCRTLRPPPNIENALDIIVESDVQRYCFGDAYFISQEEMYYYPVKNK